MTFDQRGQTVGDQINAGDIHRAIATEAEAHITLYWDDDERRFRVREIKTDAEFTSEAALAIDLETHVLAKRLTRIVLDTSPLY